jgi:hypothetical protein
MFSLLFTTFAILKTCALKILDDKKLFMILLHHIPLL